jgi:hypothetical protein
LSLRDKKVVGVFVRFSCAASVDEGVAVGVGLSLEEQLAIRPAVNVKIPNNFTVDFFMIV